jgi:leader peptidase (prepilin peptidase)/N-methyltransferase
MEFDLTAFNEAFPWFFRVVSFAFGAIVGSFLNVCIYRIPKDESIVHPGSHCACGRPIAWFDNIPIFSWMILRGRARCCGRAYGIRYPAIELLTALLFLGAWLTFDPAKACVVMLFFSMLICATFIDIDHMIIPDRFSIGGAIIGVLLSMLVPALHGQQSEYFMLASVKSATIGLKGALIGSALVLWIGLLAEVVLKKEAMGFGDVKLMGAIGAFCGWKGAVFSIFGGAILGVIGVVIWTIVSRIRGTPAESKADDAKGTASGESGDESNDGPALGVPIPFGPMLAAGAVIYLLWASPLVESYYAENIGRLLSME